MLVVVSFVVPLGLLVRRQAVDSARVAAERDAQSVAALVALSAASADDPDEMGSILGSLPEGTIVVLRDAVLGSEREGQGTLTETATARIRTIAGDVDDGWEIALPVITSSQVVVVNSFVTSEELTAGVSTAWLLLGMLAVILIVVAVWVADRLGRSLTRPIEALARSAHRLAEGDLETRVEPDDPEEIRKTGEAFNYLAGRLDQLLADERENAADLSHRLRTPLTSLRLQAEALNKETEREAMIGQIDRLERAMNQVIELARSPAAHAPGQSRLNDVVEGRAAFWKVLADEQGREMVLDLADFSLNVPLSEDDLGVLLDALVGNVFAHTPPGTGFRIRTMATSSGAPVLEVADSGPGMGPGDRAERGVSGTGSTGLGLDIVRKTARSVGGSVEVNDRPGSGAVVRVVMG